MNAHATDWTNTANPQKDLDEKTEEYDPDGTGSMDVDIFIECVRCLTKQAEDEVEVKVLSFIFSIYHQVLIWRQVYGRSRALQTNLMSVA